MHQLMHQLALQLSAPTTYLDYSYSPVS